MFIKYVGGRNSMKVLYGRRPFIFSPENNYTIEIKEREVINYIFGLPNRIEFEVLETKPVEEPKKQTVVGKKGAKNEEF